MQKKKPEGTEFKQWCREWSEADHDEKLKLAERYNITYESARHWFSDAPLKSKGSELRPMRMTAADLLQLRPSINLDFCSFDIETSNLDADFSILLSAVIKPFGCPPIVFRADNYPAWKEERANDYSITKAIMEELGRHAIIITHYGSKFDIPFMKAKLVHHGLPTLPPMFGLDSWAIAWKNFKVTRRSLQNLGAYFILGEKHAVDGALWMAAAYSASQKAMDEIVTHNIADCELLEKLACLCFPYVKSIPRL
uniref:Putative RNase_H superfamily protein n=1 Tax=viral metagenome TaxID=1070528 RepID=A0A6M3IPG2_9ZZZZ